MTLSAFKGRTLTRLVDDAGTPLAQGQARCAEGTDGRVPQEQAE